VRLWSISAGEESSVSMFTLKYAQAHYARKNHTQTHTHTALYVPRVVRPGSLRGRLAAYHFIDVPRLVSDPPRRRGTERQVCNILNWKNHSKSLSTSRRTTREKITLIRQRRTGSHTHTGFTRQVCNILN
jgi:hypothetical protein